MLKIREDGTGGFVAEDGQRKVTLEMCTDCHQPMAARLTLELRLAGVKQMADIGTPDGLVCAGCLDKQMKEWDHERG